MRAMMLHSHSREIPGRNILRMTIVYDQGVLDLHPVHRGQVAHRLRERLIGFDVFEVADVLTDESLPVHHERNRVLQVRSQRQHRPRRRNPRHRPRRIPARPPQDRAVSYDRVVDAPRDRPLTDQERVRDPRQPVECVTVLVRDRFVGSVRGRHHQRIGSARREQQMVHRRVRQHDAELIGVRRHARQHAPGRGQDDGPRCRDQRSLSLG